MRYFLTRCVLLVVLLLWLSSSSLASSYSSSFCEYYDHSNECYQHRQRVESRVEKFVTNTQRKYSNLPDKEALSRYKALDAKFWSAQNFYVWTQREYLIIYLRQQIVPYMSYLQEAVNTIYIDETLIYETKKRSADKGEFLGFLRRSIVSQLIERWYDWFIARPYGSADASWNIVADQPTSSFFTTTDISTLDALDVRLSGMFSETEYSTLDAVSLRISESVYELWRWNVYLFKSADDLKSLWYTLVSHRSRVSNDKQYRRTNIATSFDQIWHVRVLNPGDELSFLHDSWFDPWPQQLYEYGAVIFLDEEKQDYGGGLCGWSTALYQWTVTNTALSKPALRNHSKRYHYLYNATIDGQYITTPWIDSTIYSWSLDLRLRNEEEHPIILVSNFEGEYGEVEEVFTLGYASDRWSATYVSSRPYHTSLASWSWSRPVVGTCYTWNINGNLKESCYKEVKP